MKPTSVSRDEKSGVVLLASYGTCSTGISIKNLHNLVFCHPTKSLISVLQSIGRMLRTHSSKTQAQIYDLVDNLKIAGDYENYAIKHAVERFGYYSREQHKTNMKKVTMAETFTTWKAPIPQKAKKARSK